MPSRSAICEVATKSAKAAGRKRPGPEERSSRPGSKAGWQGGREASHDARPHIVRRTGRPGSPQPARIRAGRRFFLCSPTAVPDLSARAKVLF